jgi:lipopolysaccharide transport system permease protein
MEHVGNSGTKPNQSPDRVEKSSGAEGAREPLVTIRPRRPWELPDFSEAWNNRELLYFLTWRDVKIRYKQTALGAAWAILQPLFTMVIFTFIFGRLAKIETNGIAYSLFAFAGLVPWLFFANAVSNSGNSIVGSSHLITKVYFPRAYIPAASVAASLVDFGIASLLFIPLALYHGIEAGPSLLLLPLPFSLLFLLTVAVGMWLSALNVKYRDIRYTIPFVLQIGLFLSPIVYPASAVPERFALLYMLNPMTGIIEGFRSALFGTPVNWTALAVSAALTLFFLIYSGLVFRRMEKSFADII